jgi:hypothetical protein
VNRNPRREERLERHLYISGSAADPNALLISGATLLVTCGQTSESWVSIFSNDFGQLHVPSGSVAVIARSSKTGATTAGTEEPIKKATRPELQRLIDRVVVPILVARYIRGLKGNGRVGFEAKR